MQRTHWGLLLITLLLWTSALSAEPLAVSADRIRIRAHLLEVEGELLAADVSHLSDAQRKARSANIDTVRAYRIRGEFPHNTYAPGQTPVFIDADGRACAVGHLMIESGWEDAALAISARENLARLPDMKSPEVAEWLKVSGLTAAEATRIQPSYSDTFCGEVCDCTYDGSDATRPVCGSDGKSYLNACVARACGGEISFTPGCCDPNNVAQTLPDRLVADMGNADAGTPLCSGFWGTGVLDSICESDPGPNDTDMGRPRPDDMDPDVSADSGSTTLDVGAGPRESTNACSTTNSSPAPLALLAFVLVWRRRES